MRKVLVISNDLASKGTKQGPHTFHARHEEKIQKAAGKKMQVVVVSPEEASPHFADAEVVAAFPLRVPEISKLPQAKWIHSFSAGVDKILTPEVATSKVILTNSSGIHATPIAEHIVGFMLMWTRRSAQALRNQDQHVWSKDDSLDELCGKTILIVGLGEIGMETARLAKVFGTKILATARSPRNKKDTFVDVFHTADKLDSLLPRADFVVITLPHTDETPHFFDKNKFALMQKSAVIINIGRGGIINEKDLIEAIQKGTVAGAMLDVFEKEPLPSDSPLWDMPNVLITPHHSGLSHRYMDRAVERFCLNLKAYLAGKKLPNDVDKKLGY